MFTDVKARGTYLTLVILNTNSEAVRPRIDSSDFIGIYEGHLESKERFAIQR